MRKSARSISLLTAVAALGVGVLLVTSAGAGQAGHLVVDKVVEGTQPEGTQFTIRLSCVRASDPIPVISDVVLDGPGNAIDANIVASSTCTVTEPEDGGATSVTFGCEATSGPADCDAAGNRVSFPIGAVSEATITVTNSFVEPPPPAPEPVAEALALQPDFTG